MPDCLDAFLAWLGGRALRDCAILVNFNKRLFFRCLRIVGWNHSLGNIMKRVAQSDADWPEVLTHLRHVCTFWRDGSWKLYTVRILGEAHPELQPGVAHFTAKLAK